MSPRSLGALLTALFLLLPTVQALAAASAPFANWSAVVVAGDYRDHSGNRSEIFDNARREVSAGLIADGFSKANLVQYSTLPSNDLVTNPSQTDPILIGMKLKAMATTATAGCLYYYTSHGFPQVGALYAAERDYALDPATLSLAIQQACGDRPTIVVISACYSGVYVPVLQADNRMILTAARADRTSFGCGATDKYPYFDDCFISTLKTAHDFVALSAAVQTCVAAKEKALQDSGDTSILPSEPQVSIGAAIAKILPSLAFTR